MSGTDENFDNQQSGTGGQKTDLQNQQSGTGDGSENVEALKKEIAELRKEAAKYRNSAKATSTEKQTVEEQLRVIQEKLQETEKENKRVKVESLLDKSGCIKSDLVAKVIPNDCEDISAWIEDFKKNNAILFKTEKQNKGGGYKPTANNNLTPSQQMDYYIRSAMGRK